MKSYSLPNVVHQPDSRKLNHIYYGNACQLDSILYASRLSFICKADHEVEITVST